MVGRHIPCPAQSVSNKYLANSSAGRITCQQTSNRLYLRCGPDDDPIYSLHRQFPSSVLSSNLKLRLCYNMKLGLVLAALASLSVGLAAPKSEERSISPFPSSRKKGLSYNTALYTVNTIGLMTVLPSDLFPERLQSKVGI